MLTSGDAERGARALRPLVDDLASHGRQVALICHSYGSVVCGLAAARLPVTDIAFVGSPGTDASSVRALHATARVWAGRGASDWIRIVPHVHLLGLGFGQNPLAPATAPGSSPAAPAVTAATSGRAASRCATSPTSPSATPRE